MVELPYRVIDYIEDTLRQADLDDLVAVFSQAAGDRLLFVYNNRGLPTNLPDNCQATRLDDLADVDLEIYDGLFVGLSALDVIRRDLVTKGASFYSLDQLLLKLDRRATLHRTLRNLARYLVAFLGNLSEEDSLRRQRVMIKAPQLALPALLDERGAEGVVAVLPGSDLGRFIDGRGGEWLTVADDLEMPQAVNEGNGIVVALEECRYFSPWANLDSQHFIELRTVLRRAGQTKALRQTCWALAWRLAEMAASRPECWKLAWALMSEAWLMAEDVTDLMAFFPLADFERFAQTGEGLRIYRRLDETTANLVPGPCWSLAGLQSKDVSAEFRRCGFSLAPLDKLVKSAAGIEAGDLGWVLWKADHGNTLAETLWLLARDGLENTAFAVDFPPAVLSDLAHRAVSLISLGNPWAWRQGRYAHLILAAYQTLDRALQRQAEYVSGANGDYWRAMADWHRCYATEEVDKPLRQMASHLRSFMRATRNEADGSFPDLYANARQLIEVEQAVLYPIAPLKPHEQVSLGWREEMIPDERGRMRSKAAHQEAKIALSPVFEFAWGKLMKLRQERHQVQTYEVNTDILQRKLTDLLGEAKRQRRLVFAPPHEMAVLHFIYDHELRELQTQLTNLKTAVKLEIIPLAPHVELRREVNVAFELCNAGQAEAREVHLVLLPHPSFELLEHSSVREFLNLSPGARQRISYRMRVVRQPDVTLNFSYQYGSLETRQLAPIRLPVHSPEDMPFKKKGDPYKFGRTIQNPADFFGREEQMERVLMSLQSGGHANFLLRGPRRMGKTSMLYMIKHVLENQELRRRFHVPPEWDSALDDYVPVMLDLQAFSFQDDATHIAYFFRALLDAVCIAMVPNLRADLLRAFDRRRTEIDAPGAILEQLTEVFRRQAGARVAVLLDEYDEIYRPQGRSLDTALRHVVQQEQRLTWVIASTQFLFKEGKSYGSPWFNILNTIELDCLSLEAARRLVEEPSGNQGVEWQSDAVVAVLDETGRHPAFLQLFCSKIMAHLNRVKLNYVVPQMIADLAEQIVEERETAHSHFEFFWADTPGMGQLVLLATDESDHPPTRIELYNWVKAKLQAHFGSRPEARVPDAGGKLVPWGEREFETGMAWIAQVVSAINFDRASRTYTFAVPLFRRWLQRKRHREDLLDAAMNTVATEMERDGLG